MSDLKINSTIGGNTIWNAGNLPVLLDGDNLFYKEHKLYSEFNKPTQNDVGLSNVRNVSSYSQSEANSNFLGINAKASDSNLLDGLNSTQFLRSDTNDSFSNTLTGNQLYLGGSQITPSAASLQVNGFMRTGNIVLHEGGSTPTTENGTLGNSNGRLQWNSNNVYTTAYKPSASDIGALPVNGKAADSNLLDGLNSTDFARSSHTHDASDINSGTLSVSRIPTLSEDKLNPTQFFWGNGNHKLWNNDGTGNAGISFGADGYTATESGRVWRINVANDSTTGNMEFQRSTSSVTSGSSFNVDNVLILKHDRTAEFSSDLTVNGTMYGNGNGITNLDANNMSTGTLSSSRLPTITAGMTSFANQSLNTGSNPTFNGMTLNGELHTNYGEGLRMYGKNFWGSYGDARVFQAKDSSNTDGGFLFEGVNSDGSADPWLEISKNYGLKWLGSDVHYDGNSDKFSTTGTYSGLRAQSTTKADVGLSNIPNLSVTDSASGNTIMQRNASGDTWARLFRSSYTTTNSSIAGIYTTRQIGGDYMRPSTPSQVKSALNITASDVGLGSVRNVSSYSQRESDGRYLNESSNLSDLPNKSTARSNLGLSDAATTTVSTIRSGVTANDVGLGSVRNVSSYSQNEANSNFFSRSTGVWQSSSDGQDRFYFATNSHTYIQTGSNIYFRNSANNTMATITSAGKMLADSFQISSDSRLKDDIKPLTDNSGIQLKSWDWKNNKKHDTGVIAQDVEKEYPTCVSEVDGYLSVDYGKLGVHHSIKLAEKVEQLEKRLEDFENKSIWSLLIFKIKRLLWP